MASTNIHTFDGSVGVGTNTTAYKFDVFGGETNMGGDTTITTLSVTDTTNSTGTGDGALKIAGGLGVAKKLHVERLLITEKLGIGLAGAATETVEVNGTTSATRVDIGGVSYGHVPSGVILMWHGDIASPPSGWAICDGTSGTPDLQGYMIIGRNGTYTAGSTGGNSDLTMTTGTLPSHEHTGTTDTDGAHTHASVTTAQAGQHSHSGDTAQHNQSHSHSGDTSTNGQHAHGTSNTGNSGVHAHGVSNQGHGHNHFAAHAGSTFAGIGGHNGNPQTFNIFGWVANATIGFGVANSGNHTHTLTISSVGQHTHELTVTDDPAHLHSISTTQNGGHEHTFTTVTDGSHLHTATTQQTGGGQSFEKLPPYRAIAYIMKL